MTTICLSMIVKNEASVICRCLESVRSIIDYWVIVDTGSTDATQDVIRDYFRDLPGELHERPWRDFAHNRSEALTLARPHGDYSLIIDADDHLVLADGFEQAAFKAGMQHDLYDVEIRHGESRFFRPQICSNHKEFFYKAVLHEYLEAPPGELTRLTVEGFYIETSRDGARGQNPRKYHDDAATLEKALITETDPFLISRYKFYLAQSYKDAGESEKALKAYLERAELGFWSEEIFESLYSAGCLMEKFVRSDTEIIGTYLRAYGYSPNRVESLQALVRYCHQTGKAPLGYLIGKHAITKPMPPTGLFVQRWVYDYAMLDDFAVAAYWAGEFRDCLDACENLLKSGKLPPQHRARVEANASFAKSNLATSSDTGETAAVVRAKPDGATGILSHPHCHEDMHGRLPDNNRLTAGNLPHEQISESLDATSTIEHASVEPAPIRQRDDGDRGGASLERTFQSCPVCDESGTSKPRPDLEPHPYVACRRCGLFYQPYMRAKVFEAHHEPRGDLMSKADRQANRHLAGALFHNHLARRFAGQDVFHLDIGSKYPFFGHCLQAIASEHDARLISHGIDGIAEAREFGRQLDVLMAIGDFEAGPQTWDMPAAMAEHMAHSGFHCVSLIHCLEHLYNPLRTLRAIRDLMADGGVLFIRSPDSRAPGIECDFTSGHYDIHPLIWCEDAMHEALLRLPGSFEVYETYEIGHQRDYLLRAVDRKVMVGSRSIVLHDQSNVTAKKFAPDVINILRPGAIGDVLVTGAVTAQFAARNPGAEIHYYTKIPQMAELLVGVDKVLDADQWDQRKPGRDYNLTGYPLGKGYPERPMQSHLTAYFCEEAGVPHSLPQLRELEPFTIKQRSWITIHPKAGWSVYKEWSIENWHEILMRFHRTYPEIAIVQIGGSDDPALQETDYDLRGRTSISQALWLLKNSVLHLGVDSFTNHAAGAFRHPAVIVFGSTSPTGSGYDTAVNLWAGLPCSPCYRENPLLSRQSRGPCINPPGQVYEQPRHACMRAITGEAVWQAIAGLMPPDDRGRTDPELCSDHADEIGLQQ